MIEFPSDITTYATSTPIQSRCLTTEKSNNVKRVLLPVTDNNCAVKNDPLTCMQDSIGEDLGITKELLLQLENIVGVDTFT